MLMIHFKMFNKKLFLDLLLIFSSFTIIFIYIYLRITKKEVVISLMPEEIQAHFLLFLYFFAISCIMLGVLLFNLLRKTIKKEGKRPVLDKLFLNIKEKMNTINIFYKSYSILFYALSPKYTQYLVTYINKLIDYSDFKNNCIIFMSVVVPRLLIIFVFIFELYQKTLHYYFFFLLLLLIPLFFRFLIFIYSDIEKQVLPELQKLVETYTTADNITLKSTKGPQEFKTISFRFKPEYATNSAGQRYDINHFMQNFYNPVLFIGGHMEVNILPLYYKINNLTMWIYTIIQATGWGYVLFYLV